MNKAGTRIRMGLPQTRRRCLKCNKWFWPRDMGNHLCDSCNEINATLVPRVFGGRNLHNGRAM